MSDQETWPAVLKKQYCAMMRLPETEVNLLNFSQGGASNDYIVRVLTTQCDRVRPQLVIAAFTRADRTEYISDDDPATGVAFGPWLLRTIEEGYDAKLAALLTAAYGFYAYQSDVMERLNLLKNMLLLQCFLREKQIPYLFTTFDDYSQDDSDLLQTYCSSIDFSRVLPISVLSVATDVAADGRHPGTQSHQAFARRVLTAMQELGLMN